MEHHQSSSSSESEKFITRSMIEFINHHIHSANLSALDEIILNYVATVLECLAKESGGGGDLGDSFDVEEFCEMLAAYFPGFESIPHALVTQWIFELVGSIRKEAEIGKPKNEEMAFESFLTEIEANESLMRSKRNSESSSDSSSTSGKPTSSTASRSPKISETSDGDLDSDVSYIINRLQSCQFQCDDNIDTLLEMFPSIQKPEAQHFLATTNGDLEKAVQLVLVELENGVSGDDPIKRHTAISLSARFAAREGKSQEVEEKVLKDRIVARYGFIDQAEDKKEFRPPPLKSEPKKLVRYRESQVVSTKGERYSEVKCGADGGEIKNYIYKPPKPY